MTSKLTQTLAPLGLAPPPLDDEPLDGYLEHLAHSLQVPIGALLAHLGLNNTSASSLVRGVDDDTAQRLGRCLSLPASQVHDMTLRRYASVGLMPSGVNGGGPGPWLRRKGTRFCPACLRERDNRWRLSWYLQWTYICLDHATLLDVACPTCDRPPRTRRAGHPIHQKPTVSNDERGMTSCDCPVTLLASADQNRDETQSVLDAPVPVAFWLAQQIVTERITTTEAVTHLGVLRPNTEWLHDLAAITRLVAVNAPHDHIPDTYADVIDTLLDKAAEPPGASQSANLVSMTPVMQALRAWAPHLGLESYSAPAARFTQAGASRVAFPILATLGVAVLTAESATHTTDLLARLLPAETRRVAAMQSRRRGISWPLARALWLGEHRVAPSRLRTIRLGGDRFLADGTERIPLDPARIPARPWPSVRLALPWTARDGFTGLAFTAALLSAVTSRPLSAACDLVGHKTHAPRVASETRRLLAAVAEATDGSVFDDLLALHDAITTDDIPIDYQRRRHVFAQPVTLARRTATQAARELDQRPTPRLARFMSWWIHEQLTGNDILLHPDLLNIPGAIRSLYDRQRTAWDDQPPALLLRRAEHALLVNCIDEPITWSPVLNTTGTWHCPPPDLTRQLDWSHRHRRASVRPSQPVTRGLSLKETVILARSAQSARTDRLARMLARFHAVVDAPTIASAAAQLGMSQAALSRVIANLEAELDTALFTRTHQANVLTENGHRLHRLLRIHPITHVSPARVPRPGETTPIHAPEKQHA